MTEAEHPFSDATYSTGFQPAPKRQLRVLTVRSIVMDIADDISGLRLTSDEVEHLEEKIKQAHRP